MPPQLALGLDTVGVHSPGHIAPTDEEAREELWPAYREMRDRISAERGWRPTSRAEFDLKYSAGARSHDAMMRSIGLYGREVIPRVRALLGAG